MTDLQLVKTDVNTGYFIRGYFNAPYTGNYKFYTAADDTLEFYLSTDASS